MAYNPNFQWKRKLITIDGTKVTTQTAIPLMIQVQLPGVKSGGADIRLTKFDGTSLAREIEYHWVSDDTVALFFPFDTIASTDSQLYIYWGNSELNEPTANSTYGSQKVWDSNYLLVSHMNQEPNGNATGAIKDSTSNGNNITPYNFSTNHLVDTTYGKGISFLATVPHYMKSINNIGLSGTSVRTLEISTESISAYGAIANIGTNGVNNQYGIWYGAPNMMFFAHGPGNDYDTGTVMPITGDVYCVATYDGSTVRTYLGGSPTATPSAVRTLNTVSNSLQLGYRISDNTPYLTGIIGEVRVSNIQRSASYISTTSNNLKNPTASGTAPFYKTFGSAETVIQNPQRKAITINTTTATPANYQIKLTIPFAPEMNYDFSDLRFVTKTNVPLSYWIESSTPGTTADVWVKLADSISTSSSDYIYMHYGNPNLTGVSNGANTFDFFDDFSGDLSKWTLTQSTVGNVQIVSNELRIKGNDSSWQGNGLTSISTIAKPAIIEWTSKTTSASINAMEGYSVQPLDYNKGILMQEQNTGNEIYLIEGAWSGTLTSLILNVYVPKKMVLPSGNGFDLYYNNTLYVHNTSWANSNNANRITFNKFDSANYFWVDNVRVRKYVDTEPTFSIGSAEAMNTFSNRKTLTINNSLGTALADYQAPITVTYASAMQANFNDIRFVDVNGNLLPCWLESKTDSTTAKFWIKVNLQPGNSTVYMYYGNQNLISASDGPDTFVFFDDFPEASVDTGKWTTVGSAVITSGKLRITGSGTWNTNGIVTNALFDRPIIVEWDEQYSSTSAESLGGYSSSISLTYMGYYRRHVDGNRWLGKNASLDVNMGAQTLINEHMTLTILPTSGEVLKIGSTPYTTSSYTDTTQGFMAQVYTTGVYVDIDNVRVRKYASTEPAVSIGTEEGITATAMTVSPRESPCRVGICIVDVSVTWTGNGGIGTLTPSIVVDSTTYSLAPESLGGGSTITKTFAISGLSTGTHSICPNPN